MNKKTKSRRTMWTNPKSEWPVTFRKLDFTDEMTEKLRDELRSKSADSEKERIDAFDLSVQDSSLAKSVG